jgi:hypothetical protein
MGFKFGQKRLANTRSMSSNAVALLLATLFNSYFIIKHSSCMAWSTFFLGLTPITLSR